MYDFIPAQYKCGLVRLAWPYQGISSINEYVFVGNDNYNSLQSQFRLKRQSWQTTLNYTYGKAMGDANGGSNYRSSYSTDQNSYCLTCEYGPRNFDRTHIFQRQYHLCVAVHPCNNRMEGRADRGMVRVGHCASGERLCVDAWPFGAGHLRWHRGRTWLGRCTGATIATRFSQCERLCCP